MSLVKCSSDEPLFEPDDVAGPKMAWRTCSACGRKVVLPDRSASLYTVLARRVAEDASSKVELSSA